MGVCDVCNKELGHKEGHLLTTKQVVSTPAYWKKAFSGPMGAMASSFGMDDSFKVNFISGMASQTTAWMICDDCISIFNVDRNLTRDYALKWYDSNGTFVPPGCGAVPLSEVNTGDGKVYMQGGSPEALAMAEKLKSKVKLETESMSTTESEEEPMSLTDKIIGIYSEPKRVFEEFRDKGVKTKDWLLPILLSILIAIISIIMQMNNPTIQADMRDQQIKQMQKLVAEGKITQEQADQQLEAVDRTKGLQYVFIIVGTPIMAFIGLVFMALIYWLLTKFGIRGNPNYITVLGIIGIVSMISIVEVLATAILSYGLGKFNATPTLALLFSNSTGVFHSLMSKINPFTFWSLSVIGVGLAIVSKKEIIKGIIWVFGLWIVWIILAIFVISKIPIIGGIAG